MLIFYSLAIIKIKCNVYSFPTMNKNERRLKSFKNYHSHEKHNSELRSDSTPQNQSNERESSTLPEKKKTEFIYIEVSVKSNDRVSILIGDEVYDCTYTNIEQILMNDAFGSQVKAMLLVFLKEYHSVNGSVLSLNVPIHKKESSADQSACENINEPRLSPPTNCMSLLNV